MARRRFRSNQRHEPTTERSFQEYILSTPAPQTSRTELLRLIRGGEDTFFSWVKLPNTEKIAREIVVLPTPEEALSSDNDQLRKELMTLRVFRKNWSAFVVRRSSHHSYHSLT
jgi:hypothetical protein